VSRRQGPGAAPPGAAAVLAAILATVLASSCVTPDIAIGSPDLSKVADGKWRGYYDGGLVKVEVEVGVAAHRIETVAILRHDCGKGRPAERIVGDIVARQGLDVDTVSGATYSSRVILKAVELALAAGAGG
jgi:uncharacterized protein with FMN-binding domain